jgi:4-amino-4-deoxy-L-arabinose transferase-like glycosyltransferase
MWGTKQSSLAISASPRSPILSFLIERGPARLVVITIVVGTAIRLILAATLGYGVGEGYYLASARHLALSYFDQPPVAIWVMWATTQLFGVGSTVGTRLPFIAMFAGTTWLMYRLGARLFGEWAGAWSAVLLNVSLLFTLSIGSWAQPDGPLFLFLVGAAIPVVDLCFGRPSRPQLQWAIAGAAFGLALLSKYHAVLVLAGLLLFVATTPAYRKWFFDWGLALAALIATVIVLPILIWNAENGWVSVVFQGSRIIESTLRIDWLLRSILGQAAYIGILLWPVMMVVFAKALRVGPADPRAWFCCSLAIIPILIFTAAAIWAPLGWHFHWQAPGYVFLFPLLGKLVADGLEHGSLRIWRWIWLQVVLLVAFLAVGALQARFGLVHSILPQRLQQLPYATTNPTRELVAWTGLREALVKRGLIPHQRLFAAVRSWTLVGYPDTQIGDDLPVVCLCSDPRNIAYGWNVANFAGWDALILTPKRPDENQAVEYRRYFETIDPPFDVDIDLGGEVAMTVEVSYAHKYNGNYPMPLPLHKN